MRRLSRLFVRYPSAQGENVSVSEQGEPVAVFLTPQSLASFPLAVGTIKVLVALLLALSGSINRDFAASLVATAVGGLIFVLSIEDKEKRPASLIKWVGAVGIAIINTAFLAA